MRVLQLLPLAVAATAFVIPDEPTANQLRLLPQDDRGFLDRLPSNPDDIRFAVGKTVSKIVETSRNALDDAITQATDARTKAKQDLRCAKSKAASAAQAWVDSALRMDDVEDADHDHHDHHGHHGHHGHHCHKPNMTIYQLISKSKYTTKLAKFIHEDGDLVKVLNDTSANYTLFAPTDAAIDRILDHEKEPPSKEMIKKVLLYHVSPELYTAGRVLVSHTIPTMLKEKDLGDFPQRLRVGLGFRGLELNFHSPIVAINIFGTNGVIHAVSEVITLPPDVLDIIEYLPGDFSTLQLGLLKTGLFHDFKNTATSGQTVFAPSNWAFKKLGSRINGFLFSPHGQKYLKALLKYHVVSNQTLYSDAFYNARDAQVENIPKGYFHVDLETLLDGHSLSIDVARFGGFIIIKINGFTSVTVEDGIAEDGVIQALSDVLIPPKKFGGEAWQGEPITEEDLKERLAPFLEGTNEEGEEEL